MKVIYSPKQDSLLLKWLTTQITQVLPKLTLVKNMILVSFRDYIG
jgi:hypothetical protein